MRPHLCCLWAALGLFALASCQSASRTPPAEAPRKRPLYRPGQSLEARLCECKECFDLACCGGEAAGADENPEGELGISLSVCSRCTRRVWTVRHNEDCSSRAPPQCCAASIRD